MKSTPVHKQTTAAFIMIPIDSRLFPRIGAIVLVFVLGIAIIKLVERIDWIANFGHNRQQLERSLANSRSVPDSVLVSAANREGLLIQDGQREITVFTDYECPYCRRFHQSIIPLFDNTRVRYRNMPLGIHGDAIDRAILVECTRLVSGDIAASELIHWIFTLNKKVAAALATEIPDVLRRPFQEEALQCFQDSQSPNRLAVEEIMRLDSVAVSHLNLVGTPSSVIGDVVVVGGFDSKLIDQVFEGQAKK